MIPFLGAATPGVILRLLMTETFSPTNPDGSVRTHARGTTVMRGAGSIGERRAEDAVAHTLGMLGVSEFASPLERTSSERR